MKVVATNHELGQTEELIIGLVMFSFNAPISLKKNSSH